MRLILIAAIARNGVIGRGGSLPWHLPEDLKRFKRLTTGATVLMGRKTFASIGKPLPGRRNVVLSSTEIPGVESFHHLDDALRAVERDSVVFVIGGGRVFDALLGRADELYLTLLDRDVEGDTAFPPFAHLLGEFRETFREAHPGFTFVNYTRIRP